MRLKLVHDSSANRALTCFFALSLRVKNNSQALIPTVLVSVIAGRFQWFERAKKKSFTPLSSRMMAIVVANTATSAVPYRAKLQLHCANLVVAIKRARLIDTVRWQCHCIIAIKTLKPK